MYKSKNIRQTVLEIEEETIDIYDVEFQNDNPMNTQVLIDNQLLDMQIDSGVGLSVSNYDIY